MGIDLTPELLDQIDKYLKGELSDEESSLFQEKLKQDQALKEEVIIQKQLFSSLKSNDWVEANGDEERLSDIKKKLASDELQKISTNIRNIGKEYINEEQPAIGRKYNKTSFFYAIAAALILLIVSVYILNENDTLIDQYHANVAWSELPSVIEKGTGNNNLALAEKQFKAGRYLEAINKFKLVDDNDKKYPISLAYIGAAYELLGENDKALQTFDTLIGLENSIDRSKGYWYKLLVYLKLEDLESALKTLENIKQDSSNYNYNKAVNLYKKLKE